MIEEVNEFLSLSPKGPLNHLLVIEIGGYISAPVATQVLLSEGASIIKIEPKSNGDPSRRALPPAMFTSLNAAKASIALSIMDAQYAKILSLADVIIDNRSPKAKERDRALQEFLKCPIKKHPVIYCSIVGFDSHDNKDRLAFDVSVQADTGMAWSNAFSPETPLKVGFYVLDITTGIQAASSVKTWIIALQRGYKIPEEKLNVIRFEISMANISAMFQMGQYLRYLTTGQEKIRNGNRDLFLCPFSFYKAKDGVLLSIGIVSDEQYTQFCNEILNKKELADKYPTNEIRLENSEIIEEEITEIFSKKTSIEWMDLCKRHNIACTKVNTVSEALKQPFMNNIINYTNNNIPTIPVAPSYPFFQQSKLNCAPKFDQHHKMIERLIEVYHDYGSTCFGELCTNLNKLVVTMCLLSEEEKEGKHAFDERIKEAQQVFSIHSKL